MYNVKIKHEDEEHEFDYEGIFLIGMNKLTDDGDMSVDFHGNIPEEMAFMAMCESMQNISKDTQ